MTLPALGPTFGATRRSLQLIGVHILARARHGVTGRIDLTPTVGGIGTHAFGPDHRVLRIDGPSFIIESTGDHASTAVMSLHDATLRGLAGFASVNLDDGFSAGDDTPPVGDVDSPLEIEGDSVRELGEWFAFGARVIDIVVSSLDASSASAGRARIWPEHFDLAIDVGTASGQRLNLGASPGDQSDPRPYLYVGPWSTARPGDADYWNADFGAVATYDHLAASVDPRAAAAAFMLEGVGRFDP